MPPPAALQAEPGRGQRILPLRLDDVCFEIDGRRRLDGISCEISQGPCSVILGPDGAGKSLTLRLAHGLLTPSSGSVVWLGAAAKDARRRQAMVFEKAVLLRRSAAANVEFPLKVRGVPRRERAERVAEVLEKTGLTAIAGRAARVLSAGEQQRLTLARAWVLNPEVLFLDEPTASLDPAASRSVERLIDAIAVAGTKIVMTTHDLGQARRLADEILFLHKGALLEQTPAGRFFEKPESVEARAFLAGELLC